MLSLGLKIKLTEIAEKKRIKVVSFDDTPPKLRGAIYEEFLAERYPTIRWNCLFRSLKQRESSFC